MPASYRHHNPHFIYLGRKLSSHRNRHPRATAIETAAAVLTPVVTIPAATVELEGARFRRASR